MVRDRVKYGGTWRKRNGQDFVHIHIKLLLADFVLVQPRRILEPHARGICEEDHHHLQKSNDVDTYVTFRTFALQTAPDVARRKPWFTGDHTAMRLQS